MPLNIQKPISVSDFVSFVLKSISSWFSVKNIQFVDFLSLISIDITSLELYPLSI